MKKENASMSSGIPGLDRVLQGLRAGDNVVWEVDGVGDYLPLVAPFCAEAARRKRKLVYFRFARHEPLVGEESGAEICVLDPQEGFERFLTGILDVIEKSGPGAFYVFDCLSDLAADWFSDRMLGSFFMIACPYLYELETLAYFALLKNQHSLHATQPIANTAQVIIEVFRKDNQLYIHPLKVWERYSAGMYTLHSWVGADFQPVTSSATITDILASVPKPWLEFSIYRPGIWVRTFHHAQQTLSALREGRTVDAHGGELLERLLKMVVTRDERFLALARKYFGLADVVEIMERMVGTGLIGGKTLGMLLSRAILRKAHPSWAEKLESHDSFYVGSDVFYTYLVQNGCWWLRHRRKDFELYLRNAADARRKILGGVFPESIQDQFKEMLEYFGQSPLIVRSSSLLEDNYGNAFSGKYESVFLANQGTPQERLEAFLNAVRTVYASALSEEGLRYRQHHGLLDRDEQMALLVQRVSGAMRAGWFFPHVAGVGFSFNPFVWSQDIDPQAGMLRLVFGLGTRAVDRTEDDYTRLVALNAPLRRPEATPDEVRQYAQRHVDLMDLKANKFATKDFGQVARAMPPHLLGFFAVADEDVALAENGDDESPSFAGYLSFDRLFTETEFVPVMRELCRTLQEAYNHPVDIEFTGNFSSDGEFRINLVQCRPFQVKIKGEAGNVRLPREIPPAKLLFTSHGPVVGHSVVTAIDRVIYVVPSVYGQMSISQRYSVARTIGRLIHLDDTPAARSTMLIGPGRWGTSMPWLGVPVSFAEISKASVICELAVMHQGLIPEVSLGTHFFNDLVEMDILYLAIIPGKDGASMNEQFLRERPNQLINLLPSAREWAGALWVVDSLPAAQDPALCLNVDSMRQQAVCYSASETP
ncbi:MAG TPA: PEP/pyruvate-binding domain-containing protein [Verrucomicrobiae bacterium]